MSNFSKGTNSVEKPNDNSFVIDAGRTLLPSRPLPFTMRPNNANRCFSDLCEYFSDITVHAKIPLAKTSRKDHFWAMEISAFDRTPIVQFFSRTLSFRRHAGMSSVAVVAWCMETGPRAHPTYQHPMIPNTQLKFHVCITRPAAAGEHSTHTAETDSAAHEICLPFVVTSKGVKMIVHRELATGKLVLWTLLFYPFNCNRTVSASRTNKRNNVTICFFFFFDAFVNISVSLESQCQWWWWWCCCPTLSYCQLHPKFTWIVRNECFVVVSLELDNWMNRTKLQRCFGCSCCCCSTECVRQKSNADEMHRRRTKNDSMNFRFFLLLLWYALPISLTHTNKNWTQRLIYVFYLQIIRFYWKRNDNWPFREPMKMTTTTTNKKKKQSNTKRIDELGLA